MTILCHDIQHIRIGIVLAEGGELTMDVREKLVELQSIITCPNAICNFCEHFKNKDACEKHKKEVIADNMIAHGVTVQGATDKDVGGKWISVKDRLPENICPVLVALEGLNIAFHGWYQDEKWWKVGAGSRPYTQKVTHWMPLPQPPKGE
jgi:hypothetical protein